MKCAWEAYLAVLPVWLRRDADKLGRESLQECRLRLDRPVEMIAAGKREIIDHIVTSEDLSFVVNTASRYSPWTARTLTQGYITAPGGHRIGMCGEVVNTDMGIQGIREPTSLCIRVARDFPGIGRSVALLDKSVLIIGSPGTGKTTLLRDVIRQKSDLMHATVAVVDERSEIFPRWQSQFCFSPGKYTDVLSGCKKEEGYEILLRTMTPEWIALDEITSIEDSESLYRNCWCGVKVLATAHAESIDDLSKRDNYKYLLDSGVFSYCVTLRKDKSYVQERMVK